MMTSSRSLQSRGFSLIELSVVLIIIGILLSLTIPALTPNIKRASEAKTRALLTANVDALKGFASATRAIPDNSTTGFASVVRHREDGFGSTFGYVYDTNFTTADSVCDRETALLTVKSCADSACATENNSVDNVVMIVVSIGTDGAKQMEEGDTGSTTFVTYTSGAKNSAKTFRTFDYNVQISGGPFDDFVEWVTLPELKAASGCGPERKFETQAQITSLRKAAESYVANTATTLDAAFDAASPSAVEFLFAQGYIAASLKKDPWTTQFQWDIDNNEFFSLGPDLTQGGGDDVTESSTSETLPNAGGAN